MERRCSLKLQLEENRHNTFEMLSWILEGVADIYQRLEVIARKQEDILSNQDSIDADVARFTAAELNVAAEIAALKAQVAAGTPAENLDFTGLDAIATKLESDETPAASATPVAATPAAPVDGSTTGVVANPTPATS
jgi:hypothetical protein